MKKIDILIVTKDNNDDLFECLSSINNSIDKKKYKVEVILIDDHSSNKNRKLMKNKFIKYNIYKNISISLIPLGKPIGFVKALNIGLNYSLNKKIHSDYISIVHDDIIVFDNWLDNLILYLDNNKDIEYCGSVSLNKYDRQSLSNIDEINFIYPKNIKENSNKMNEYIINEYGKCANFNLNPGLFSSIFKYEAIKKFEKFQENIISSYNIDNDIYLRLNKKANIVFNSYVYHKCRSINKISSDEYENILKATELNIKIKNSTDNSFKKVLYSFTNNENDILNFKSFDKEYEYICFTLNKSLLNLKNVKWKIFYVEDFEKYGISVIDVFLKLHPHLFFDNKEISIWFDFKALSDFKINDYSKIASLIKKDNFMFCLNSIKYKCSYRFLVDMYKNNEIDETNFNSIIQLYKWFNFNLNLGLADTNILIRHHNDSRCISTMEIIWNYYKKYFKCEKLFFNFVMWIKKYNYSYINNDISYKIFLKLKDF